MDDNQLLKFALDAGALMLSSGAETHRVQDTMRRILSVSHSVGAEALAVSTFLIVSLPSENAGSLTLTRGIQNRSVNFEKICAVNRISRAFVAGSITLAQAIAELDEAEKTTSFPEWLRILSLGIACGGFTMVLGGKPVDGIAAFLFGIIIGAFTAVIDQRKIPYVFTCLFGGFIAGSCSLILQQLVPTAGRDLVIIGSIMPLLPGITITNSIRDLMEGNLVSGTTKMVEALLVAFAIAGGAGFGVSLWV